MGRSGGVLSGGVGIVVWGGLGGVGVNPFDGLRGLLGSPHRVNPRRNEDFALGIDLGFQGHRRHSGTLFGGR